MEIKKASLEYIDEIMKIYQEAKEFMNLHGNPDQWPEGYPSRDLILHDFNHMYICFHEKKVAAVFYYAIEEDEDYQRIEGHWLNNNRYGVVHRVSSAHIVKGAAKFILKWAYEQIPNIKMDTGENNIPMQNLLKSCGFQYCGKVVHEDNIKCLAYQKGEKDEI